MMRDTLSVEPRVGSLLKTSHDGPARLVIQMNSYFCMHTGKVAKRMLLLSNGETFWASISDFYQVVQY